LRNSFMLGSGKKASRSRWASGKGSLLLSKISYFNPN
jgi:hypothetical protein